MPKRFQIFISSTYDDLKEERGLIWQSLTDHNYIVAGMESFPASSDEPFEYIKPIIALSDYFVLIIGSRYGSIHKSGKSYTEMELDYALSLEIPILVFDIDRNHTRGGAKVDIDDIKRGKLEQLRLKAADGRMVAYWKGATDLCSLVVQAVIFEEKRNPRVGWIRSEEIDIQSILIENKELKEKVEIFSEIFSLKETMTIDEMKNELSVEVRSTARYTGGQDDFNIPLYRIIRLESLFSNPSKKSIEESVKVVTQTYLNEKIKENTPNCSVNYFITDPILLKLRRLRIIEFKSGEDISKLSRGVNWILAHEACNILAKGLLAE